MWKSGNGSFLGPSLVIVFEIVDPDPRPFPPAPANLWIEIPAPPAEPPIQGFQERLRFFPRHLFHLGKRFAGEIVVRDLSLKERGIGPSEIVSEGRNHSCPVYA